MNVRQQSMRRYNGNVTCLDYNMFSIEYFDGTSQARGTCLEYNVHNLVFFYILWIKTKSISEFLYRILEKFKLHTRYCS